jgi:prepilin-type N-terminal cleavage/methylation domain-containing protein
MRKHPISCRFFRGFTLVESIIVLVILGLAMAGITTLTINLGSHQTENQEWQIGLKQMQACAEDILAQRRASADLSTFVPSCAGLPGSPALSPTVPYTGVGCPAGQSCKLYSITVAVNGSNLTPITLLLVPY